MSFDLQSFVASLQFNNCLSLVITTAVTYDYIITFPNEIQYIWNRPWSFVSFLFTFVRYVGLTTALIEGLFGSTFVPGPNPVSTALFVLSDWSFLIFLTAADLVMILRVYAMYNRSRIVLGVLLVFCVATFGIYGTSAAMYNNPASDLTMTNPRVLGVSFCAPTYTTSFTLGRYKVIPRLTLAAILFTLVLARLCMESFRMYKATNQWAVNQYLNLFVSEGVLYFIVHLLNNINFGNGTAGSVMTTAIFILMFVLSPRFIMNVRELYLYKLRHGYELDQGINSGFGMWDNKAFRVLAAPSVEHADVLETLRVAEGDVEMQRVETNIDSER